MKLIRNVVYVKPIGPSLQNLGYSELCCVIRNMIRVTLHHGFRLLPLKNDNDRVPINTFCPKIYTLNW